MGVKWTILMQERTNISNPTRPQGRIAGWSESYYTEAGFGQTTLDNFRELCRLRARVLPTGAAVIGQRFQQVLPVGASQSLGNRYPGRAGDPADIPQMAVNFKIVATNFINTKSVILRGVPDGQVEEGEFAPTTSYRQALLDFFGQLSLFQFRSLDKTDGLVGIISITPNTVAPLDRATVYTDAPYALTVGNRVKILRTLDASKRQVGGVFTMHEGIDATHFSINGWTLGPTVGGKARRNATIWCTYSVPDNLYGGVVTTKKVGLPSNRYRGRASKRR